MEFDVIVIGAGHAGLEAAFACNKRGLKTALITLEQKSIGMMPCNPSIGGPAKGIVTREIDCLGGMQAIAADACQLQMKLLNTSKGPGVWALRSQTDKVAYHKWFIQALKETNIEVIFAEVSDLIVDNKVIKGVILKNNIKHLAKYVIITTGTYLKSITYRGSIIKNEGPDGLLNSSNLSKCLEHLGFSLIRLKTGTPPRIKQSSIDYTNLQIEPGTDKQLCFSHNIKHYLPYSKQLPCYIIHTNDQTHEIIRDNLQLSAMYGGHITGTGPRYCPSIEDKIVKFADKPRHQVFIEPESKELDTIYLGGFSTSMPVEVQEKMIRTLPGLKNCVIDKFAYAIEYDAIDPRQLHKSLESKLIKRLYFAGQINGTSGYEEAASQGLIAGINVANDHDKLLPLILKRYESYIGVMIDDITSKGVTEPYRLLTSRAEYRLNLRNDNADDRLLLIGFKNKMILEDQYKNYQLRKYLIDSVIDQLKLKTIGMYKELCQNMTKTNQSLYDYLKRPEVTMNDLIHLLVLDDIQMIDDELKDKINILVKFEGYIKKQNDELAKFKDLTIYSLLNVSDYNCIGNLSLEAIDKLNKIKPDDLDQASKISGINFSDIFAIKLFLDKSNKLI